MHINFFFSHDRLQTSIRCTIFKRLFFEFFRKTNISKFTTIVYTRMHTTRSKTKLISSFDSLFLLFIRGLKGFAYVFYKASFAIFCFLFSTLFVSSHAILKSVKQFVFLLLLQLLLLLFVRRVKDLIAPLDCVWRATRRALSSMQTTQRICHFTSQKWYIPTYMVESQFVHIPHHPQTKSDLNLITKQTNKATTKRKIGFFSQNDDRLFLLDNIL